MEGGTRLSQRYDKSMLPNSNLNRNGVYLMRKTFPRLIEVTQNLLNKREKKHSFIYRTNTHVLPPRPEETPAVAMNDYIDHNFHRSTLEQNGFSLLRLGEVTDGPGGAHYMDHMHPDRYLTQLFLRMLIHIHCST